MAFDTNFRTSQEYLNIKAGFTGTLRSKQECMASLAGRRGGANLTNIVSEQDCANTYAGTTGKITTDTDNNKVGSVGVALTEQEAIRRF